jgi:hypothetical protein
MSFRRNVSFNTPQHLRNYEAFMRRQRNAGENLGLMRTGASARAQDAFLRAERVFHQLPDRVSRNVYKQLLRRSLKRLATAYKSAWQTHPAQYPSSSPQPSLRRAASSVIQSMGDTRGLKTTARTGMRYRRKPRSYVAPIVDAKGHWRIKRHIQNEFPAHVLKDDLATVIEQQFDELVRKARLKARKS